MVPESNYRNGEGGSFASFGGYIEQGTDLARNEFLLQTFREIGLSNYPEIEGFRFCSSADLSRACSVMKTFIESRGGSFRYGARILSVERFLGWPKAVTYLQDGSRKTVKASSRDRIKVPERTVSAHFTLRKQTPAAQPKVQSFAPSTK